MSEHQVSSEETRDAWAVGGEKVIAALRNLTPAQRRHVEAGYIGDASMAMVRTLQRKAMFYHHITSPNGRCGPMELTPLGKSVQATIKSQAADKAQATS